MNDQLEMIPGSTRDHSLSQFFTPPKLAAKLVEWALAGKSWTWNESDSGFEGRTRPLRVLEPSAGNGAIVRPLVAAGAEVTAVELDERYTDELVCCNLHRTVAHENFLQLTAEFLRAPFDLCVGNFPFHLDLEGEFTLQALKFAPRVCAIYPANFPYSKQRIELWKQVRPTRIAHISKRPWPGATDYVALELVKREQGNAAERYKLNGGDECSIEWWTEAWD